MSKFKEHFSEYLNESGTGKVSMKGSFITITNVKCNTVKDIVDLVVKNTRFENGRELDVEMERMYFRIKGWENNGEPSEYEFSEQEDLNIFSLYSNHKYLTGINGLTSKQNNKISIKDVNYIFIALDDKKKGMKPTKI